MIGCQDWRIKVARIIELTSQQSAKLDTIRKGRSSALRAIERAAIILLAADGLDNQEIARQLGQDKMKVGRWRRRYAEGGLAAILMDKSRPRRTTDAEHETSRLLIESEAPRHPAMPGASEADCGRLSRWAGPSYGESPMHPGQTAFSTRTGARQHKGRLPLCGSRPS